MATVESPVPIPEQGDAGVEDAQAAHAAAGDDDEEPEQRANIACLGHAAAGDPSLQCAGHEDGSQHEHPPQRGDAGRLADGHPEGLRAERLQQDILTQDRRQQQPEVDEE